MNNTKAKEIKKLAFVLIQNAEQVGTPFKITAKSLARKLRRKYSRGQFDAQTSALLRAINQGLVA